MKSTGLRNSLRLESHVGLFKLVDFLADQLGFLNLLLD
jgi:hypothetical protein